MTATNPALARLIHGMTLADAKSAEMASRHEDEARLQAVDREVESFYRSIMSVVPSTLGDIAAQTQSWLNWNRSWMPDRECSDDEMQIRTMLQSWLRLTDWQHFK